MVVIERHHDIKLAAQGAHKEGISGLATGHSGMGQAQALQHGVNQVALLGSEQAVFAGMGVKSAHADPRGRHALGPGEFHRRVHGPLKIAKRQVRRHLAQRDVPGEQHDPQLASAERHGRLAAPARRKKLGLPGIRVSDLRQPGLAHGTGHHTGKLARPRPRRRPLHRRPRHERAFAIGETGHGRIRFATNGDQLIIPQGQGRQPRGWTNHHQIARRCFEGAQPALDDLRPDARRVATSEGEAFHGSVRSPPSADAPRRGRENPRLPPAKNSRNRLLSAAQAGCEASVSAAIRRMLPGV